MTAIKRLPAAGDIWSLANSAGGHGMVLVGAVGPEWAATVPVTDNIALAGESSPVIPAARSHTGRALLILSGRANHHRPEEFGSCLVEAAVTAEQAGWMAVEKPGTGRL